MTVFDLLGYKSVYIGGGGGLVGPGGGVTFNTSKVLGDKSLGDKSDGSLVKGMTRSFSLISGAFAVNTAVFTTSPSLRGDGLTCRLYL